MISTMILPFVSKLSERAVADQLMQHVVDRGVECELQSAFKKHSSLTKVLSAPDGA